LSFSNIVKNNRINISPRLIFKSSAEFCIVFMSNFSQEYGFEVLNKVQIIRLGLTEIGKYDIIQT